MRIAPGKGPGPPLLVAADFYFFLNLCFSGSVGLDDHLTDQPLASILFASVSLGGGCFARAYQKIVSDRGPGAFSIDSIEKSPHSPQHFLYFRPLPHGQGSFRPTFFAATIVFGGFNKISRSLISSGSSGSNPIVNFQPFFSNSDATSFIRFSVCTRTMAGFFSVPNFAAFFPSNIFSISSPLYKCSGIYLSHSFPESFYFIIKSQDNPGN